MSTPPFRMAGASARGPLHPPVASHSLRSIVEAGPAPRGAEHDGGDEGAGDDGAEHNAEFDGKRFLSPGGVVTRPSVVGNANRHATRRTAQLDDSGKPAVRPMREGAANLRPIFAAVDGSRTMKKGLSGCVRLTF